ncbi:MAG: formate dehydrogenase accessory sulfurtransferase FdhD [Peptococcales bacterium]|jgi:FdhD protein
MFVKKQVQKYSERSGLKEDEVFLALEERITIFLNNLKIISLLCSPNNLEELALGFLYGEGLVCSNSDYWEIEVNKDEKEVYVYAEESKNMQKLLEGGTLTSGCGRGITFSRQEKIHRRLKSNLNLELNQILHYTNCFQRETLFENNTGGIHNAGLLTNGELVIRKDVGRHNAVDKINGYCLFNSIEIENEVLFLTGRISSEIVMKGAKMQIPFIVSLSGATSLAIELAQEFGITIFGYVRGKNAVIY